MLQMQPLSGNQRPDLLTLSLWWTCLLYCACHADASLQILFKCPTPAIRFGHATTLTFCSSLARCRIPCACHAKRHPNVQKCSDPLVFSTFDLEMCFAPQRRALFRHLNFKKCSEAGVFCTFWLGCVLRAATVCTFSTSPLPKVVRCPLALLPSCPLALLPSCSLLLFYFSSEGGGRGSANETARNATLSHETRFDRQKLK